MSYMLSSSNLYPLYFMDIHESQFNLSMTYNRHLSLFPSHKIYLNIYPFILYILREKVVCDRLTSW